MSRSCLMSAMAALALFAQVAGAQPATSSSAVDPKALFDTGRQAAGRFRTEPVKWTRTFAMGAAKFRLNVEKARDRRRIGFVIEGSDSLVRVAELIETPDAWYLTNLTDPAAPKREKFRPFEAVMPMPMMMLMHQLANPEWPMEVARDTIETARVAANTAETVTLQFENPQKQLVADAKAEIERKLGGKPMPAEMKAKIAALEAQAQLPIELILDRRNGFIAQQKDPRMSAAIVNFGFLPASTEITFEAAAYQDRTQVATAARDLVMISHDPSWTPDRRNADGDACLLDLASGGAVRVPSRYGITTPGCFSKDRRFIYITPFDATAGGFRVVEINLATGENRVLSASALATATMLPPVLSPDGKSLAIAAHLSSMKTAERAIFFVDIASGKARQVSEPMDVASLNCLPDGGSMLFATHENAADKPRSTIVSMSLIDGKTTPLFAGDAPVVLGDSRVFYRDADDLWYTRKLDGGDKQRVGDGLKGSGFPTLAPDGKRVLLIRFDKQNGPKPMIVDLKTGAARVLDVPKGLWAQPAWQ